MATSDRVASEPAEAISLLEALVVNNAELEQLEALAARFNLFEAIGTVHQELRHSDFLAFLLDPTQSHGLRDKFLRSFLQRALSGHQRDAAVTALELDLLDLSRSHVRREWRNIDIFVTNDEHKLAVIIENKILSGEHSDQLNRYYAGVTRSHGGWRILPLYLSPEGDESSHDQYIPVNYGAVADATEALLQGSSLSLPPEIALTMLHYAQMVRRHVVADSEVAKLCADIYRKHQRALDLIFEHLPDDRAQTRAFLEDLIQKTEAVVLEVSTKTYIRFRPAQWDHPILNVGTGLKSCNAILVFEFSNSTAGLDLKLFVGPGPDDVRTAIHQFALGNQPLLQPQRSLATGWAQLYARQILIPAHYRELDLEQRVDIVRQFWQQFVAQDFAEIRELVDKTFLSSSAATAEGFSIAQAV